MSPFLRDVFVFFIVFGIVSFISGLVGFVKAQSVPSLIAGGTAGVLLIAGTVLFHYYLQVGLAIDLIVSLALLGRFGPALFRRKFNPAGYIVPFAVIGIALTLMAFLSPGAHP